jgi:hypothetical protein
MVRIPFLSGKTNKLAMPIYDNSRKFGWEFVCARAGPISALISTLGKKSLAMVDLH